MASPTHSPGKEASVAEYLVLELFTLLNAAMLEKGGSKACASQSRKTITNHNSMDASKIHSATTNCPKQKYNSLYKQVLPTAEGYHRCNQEEMFVSSIQNGSGDLFCLHKTHLRAKPLPYCHMRCHRHVWSSDTAASPAAFCTSAQGPQHGFKSSESLDHGTLCNIQIQQHL